MRKRNLIIEWFKSFNSALLLGRALGLRCSRPGCFYWYVCTISDMAYNQNEKRNVKYDHRSTWRLLTTKRNGICSRIRHIIRRWKLSRFFFLQKARSALQGNSSFNGICSSHILCRIVQTYICSGSNNKRTAISDVVGLRRYSTLQSFCLQRHVTDILLVLELCLSGWCSEVQLHIFHNPDDLADSWLRYMDSNCYHVSFCFCILETFQKSILLIF